MSEEKIAQLHRQRNYWKRRAEAAENYINASEIKPNHKRNKRNYWIRLINQGEPK